MKKYLAVNYGITRDTYKEYDTELSAYEDKNFLFDALYELIYPFRISGLRFTIVKIGTEEDNKKFMIIKISGGMYENSYRININEELFTVLRGLHIDNIRDE